MPKKSRKEKTRNRRHALPSIQTQEKVTQKPYTVPAPSTKTTSPKSSASTKTMPDYSYIYTELKTAGIIAGIILILIIVLWLIMR